MTLVKRKRRCGNGFAYVLHVPTPTRNTKHPAGRSDVVVVVVNNLSYSGTDTDLSKRGAINRFRQLALVWKCIGFGCMQSMRCDTQYARYDLGNHLVSMYRAP